MKGNIEKGYFHICTDGNSLPWMFQDDEDFIVGINRIGVCSIKTKIEVITFVLMDNHVHFVLYGSMPDCKDFITLYKRLTGKWILIKYGIGNYLHGLPTEIIRMESEESILNTIAYIDRNPLIAGYRYMPGEYPWGSSRYLFRDKENMDRRSHKGEKFISAYTRREQISILKSNIIVPDNWKVNEVGMLDPSSFIDIEKLESFYKTPIRYSYFLAKKLEGVVEHEMRHSQKTFIADKELRIIVAELAKENFGNSDIRGLKVNERLSIAKTLRYSYASSIKQISRMLYLERTALEGFI